ncbi:hypothetical protein OUZ56_000855 [Daphnia magna]|uniref:Secreted protein n=1 Tax=Daphnia magna TaxID=35525 RepID=A0ABR0A0Z0_9CRUS|nr:hypothetical protein OUZ56_000855 [Daphnia magna]
MTHTNASLFTVLLPLLLLMRSVKFFVFIFFANWNSGMVVESLSHQLQCQRILLSGCFLDFGSFVLEPDFDLVFVQLQLIGKLLATLLVQVTILRKLVFKTG